MNGPYHTIDAIKQANQRGGYHFFEASTLRFFDSRILPTVYGGRYFITSEQFHGSDGYTAPRKYTIRRAEDSGDINTIGEFQAYNELREAKQAAQTLAEQEEEVEYD
jgi:hypothetical protein